MHILRRLTGRYDLPIKLTARRHRLVPRLPCGRGDLRAVEAPPAPDLQEELLDHTMSCTGTCHPAAHPEAHSRRQARLMTHAACLLALLSLAILFWS